MEILHSLWPYTTGHHRPYKSLGSIEGSGAIGMCPTVLMRRVFRVVVTHNAIHAGKGEKDPLSNYIKTSIK